jgi:hypothetical protein
MRWPGTLAILRVLIWMDRGPDYARLYFRLRWDSRSVGDPSVFMKSAYDVGTLMLMLFCCSTTPVTYFALLWLSHYDGTQIVWGITMLSMILVSSGFALITYRISRAVIYEQIRNRWTVLLTTPDERYRMVLYTLGHAYRPYLSMIALAVLMLAALLASHRPNERSLLIMALLLIEWFQLQAFSLTAGLWGSLGRSRATGAVAPLLLILGWIMTRAAAGMLLVYPYGPRIRRAALLIGPMARIAEPHHWLVGIGVSLLYLVVLEGVIRLGFMRSITQAGEM